MKLEQGENQDRNVFNNLKRVIKNLGNLTNEQLVILNFECFHEARKRGATMPPEEEN